ncbi:MAG: hypothetical protein EBT46_04165 [Actinobacteria bacterium]|nr:hypothetical protein [Actinomycetota bacterium]
MARLRGCITSNCCRIMRCLTSCVISRPDTTTTRCIRFAEGPLARQRAAGAQVAININGSPFDRHKGGVRESTVLARAGETRMPIAYVNQVCGQDELVFDGGSFIADADGRVIARAAQFAEELLVVDVPIGDAAPTASRSNTPNQSLPDQPLPHRCSAPNHSANSTKCSLHWHSAHATTCARTASPMS